MFFIWYFAGSENTGCTLIVEKTSGTRQTRGPVLHTCYFPHPVHSAGLLALSQIICGTVLRMFLSLQFCCTYFIFKELSSNLKKPHIIN